MVSHIDMMFSMSAAEEIFSRTKTAGILTRLGLQLLLLCGASALLLDTHGRLFVRGLPLMTIEDRLIAAIVLTAVFWLLLGVLVLLASRTAGKATHTLDWLGALALGGAAFAAVGGTDDALFLAAYHACYSVGWCQSDPVFAHLMFVLTATSRPPGVVTLLTLGASVALAFAISHRASRSKALWCNRTQ
jgi:hypothetical protein